jgi:hypothetical protein
MNKVISLFLLASLLILTSCEKDETTQGVDERTNSEASADVMATTIGQETGGAGVIAQDASNLAEGFSFSNGSFMKESKVVSMDSTYDPTTKTHTVTLLRNKNFGEFSYNALITYNYIFFTGPVATPSFTKGVTDRIRLTINGKHLTNTPRINSDDSSHGEFFVTGMAAGGAPPTMNGTYWRGGTHTITKALQGKVITVDQTITFSDCILNRINDSTVSMTGTATGIYNATGSGGGTASRSVVATFNGDRTATLAITRTNQGVTDSCMIDVKTGKWLKWLTSK